MYKEKLNKWQNMAVKGDNIKLSRLYYVIDPHEYGFEVKKRGDEAGAVFLESLYSYTYDGDYVVVERL